MFRANFFLVFNKKEWLQVSSLLDSGGRREGEEQCAKNRVEYTDDNR